MFIQKLYQPHSYSTCTLFFHRWNRHLYFSTSLFVFYLIKQAKDQEEIIMYGIVQTL